MVKNGDLFLICFNPLAGKGRGAYHAQRFEQLLTQRGYSNIVILSNENRENIDNYFAGLEQKNGGTIISVGGDGTINTIVNAMIKHDINMDIVVYPCGTSNDFASSLKMPKDKQKFLNIIDSHEPSTSDIAKVNNIYAINAVGSGNFSHAGTVFNAHAKKFFGKFAYYSKCFFSAFNMKSNRLKITHDKGIIEGEFLFYYAVNSRVAGGFIKFSPSGSIDDGLFDFVGIKKCSFIRFCFIFLRIVFGTHHKSKYVEYFKSSKFLIETIGKNSKFEKSDIDGNLGPSHPLNIEVIKSRINVYSKNSR